MPFRLGPAPDDNPAALRDTPQSLASLLYGPLNPGTMNAGECWVSNKCALVTDIVNGWLEPLLASLPNLKVYIRTAIGGSVRDIATGRMTSISAIQRTPSPGSTGWEAPTSGQLSDWYSEAPFPRLPSQDSPQLHHPTGRGSH